MALLPRDAGEKAWAPSTTQVQQLIPLFEEKLKEVFARLTNKELKAIPRR